MGTLVNPVHADLISFLRRTGGSIIGSGGAGDAWLLGDSESPLIVPRNVGPEHFEWEGILERAARALGRSVPEVHSDVERQYVDLTEFSADDDDMPGSVSLDVGSALVDTARSLVRSSATSSRIDRLAIEGNYSRVGDRLATQARMGHTRSGSYVLPILMSLPRPREEASDDRLYNPDAYLESDERRVTRTLAQSLVAIQRVIVDPDRVPSRDVLGDLVVAGVTRESVLAVERVLSAGASAFTAQFDWARAPGEPANLPREATFQREAAEVLRDAAGMMRTNRPPKGERLTGLIVAMRDDPGEPYGEMTLRTVRSGRTCEVRVTLERARLQRAHRWFEKHEAIGVQGKVIRDPGKSLRIPEPTVVQPVSETVLFA